MRNTRSSSSLSARCEELVHYYDLSLIETAEAGSFVEYEEASNRGKTSAAVMWFKLSKGVWVHSAHSSSIRLTNEAFRKIKSMGF